MMLQRIFERVRRIELQLGVPPSHYEPGAGPPSSRRPPARPRAASRGPTPTASRPRSGRPSSYEQHAVTVDREGTVTGNTYDKYGSTNPVVRRLMAGFERTLDELFVQAAPQSILDVGCGEGVLVEKWAQRLGDGRVVGIDLDDPALHAEWEKRQAPNLEYRVMKAENLPFADGEFDMATRDRGARARAGPRAHRRRDGPRGAALAARLGPARAAVARAEHGPRRLPARPRQHARPPQPLVQALVRGAAVAARRGRRGALAVPVDDAASSRGLRRDWRPPTAPHRLTPARSAPAPAASRRGADGYARGARILSIGIASTGRLHVRVLRASRRHVLPSSDYGAISLLWSVLFVVISVIYRPVEQLLSRTIADRRARGLAGGHPLRVPLTVQGGFALLFLVVALALRGPIEDAFDGSATLYWVFVGAALAYAASYFARGYLAGHQWFGLYGGLVLFESVSRFCFPVAVALGIASGQTAVALGIVAAPLASLLVVPWALRRHAAAGAATAADARRLTLRAGAGFALSVAAIQLAEQTLLNAAVLTVERDRDGRARGHRLQRAADHARAAAALPGVQTSLLPHLAGLEATEGGDAFGRAIRITILAIAGFAGAVALGLLLIGPAVMDVVFGSDASYGRVGLAVVALGMGFHLCAGTLNQAALARGRDRAAAGAWLLAAAVFVAWMLSPVVDDELVRAEVGYAGAAALLCAMLAVLYARGRRARA